MAENQLKSLVEAYSLRSALRVSFVSVVSLFTMLVVMEHEECTKRDTMEPHLTKTIFKIVP